MSFILTHNDSRKDLNKIIPKYKNLSLPPLGILQAINSPFNMPQNLTTLSPAGMKLPSKNNTYLSIQMATTIKPTFPYSEPETPTSKSSPESPSVAPKSHSSKPLAPSKADSSGQFPSSSPSSISKTSTAWSLKPHITYFSETTSSKIKKKNNKTLPLKTSSHNWSIQFESTCTKRNSFTSTFPIPQNISTKYQTKDM